jgi:putative thioredoxin
MTTSIHIVHVNEVDFQAEVLLHSGQRPVVVDFWAEWCIPCKTLDPILENLAAEAAGAFRLAKLNVDENPRLAEEYGVGGIPSVKIFRHGQVVAEFAGVRTETQVRELLRSIEPAPADLVIGRANSLLASEDWEEAKLLFRDSLTENPDQPGALLGLARAHLAEGNFLAALPILREFPVSKEYISAELLLPLAEALAELELNQLDTDDETTALYTNALRLGSQGRLLAALDGLLDTVRANKRFRNGQPRQVILGLLEVLGEDNPATREYRAELARLLF